MRQNYISIIFLLFVLSFSVSATNRYASPNGSGNGLSYSSPTTFTSALSSLASGDTLFLLSGQYSYNAKVTIATGKSGTATKRTVIAAAAGEKPIFDFRTEPYGERGISISTGASYIHLRGLTIRYAGKNGLINYGDYCLFENCDVYGCGDSGVQMKTGGNNTILNCDSHDNMDYELGGTTAADYGGNADGFADKQHSGAPNTYIGCRAWNNSDDGWDFFDRYTTGTTIMENCICFNNGPAYYDFRDYARYATDQAWFDQFITPISVVDADGTTITASLAQYPNIGNGNGFKLGGNYSTHNVELHHCLAVNNTVNGFDQNNNYGSMTIYNCSGYYNSADYGFGNNSGGTLVVKNCLSLSSRSTNRFACQSVTNENNSWNISGISCTAADFASLDTSLVCAARQADGSLPATMFMQLADNSDMIDAGINLGLPYSGTAPDLGCYEYGDFDNFPGAVACTSANASQSVVEGTAIAAITFKWSGGATGLSVAGLPGGITQATDDVAKTLTLSGTPTANGVYAYIVSTVGGSGTPAVMQGTISVKSATAKKIAYITVPNSAADALILNKLNANMNFLVEQKDAAATNDYSAYDLVVLSPVPSSTAAGLAAVEGLDKPTLLLKPFMLKNTVWNWGTPLNTADAAMNITVPDHAIFSNINIDNNQLTLFGSVETNGVTCITSWVNDALVTEIATPATTAGQSIVEIPAGTNMNGTTLSKTLLMIGISEYSTANLTATATQLLENACYYLLGMEIGTGNNVSVQTSDIVIRQTAEFIELIGDVEVQLMTVFNVSGQMLTTVTENKIAIDNMPQGVYILRAVRSDAKTVYCKFIRR